MTLIIENFGNQARVRTLESPIKSTTGATELEALRNWLIEYKDAEFLDLRNAQNATITDQVMVASSN